MDVGSLDNGAGLQDGPMPTREDADVGHQARQESDKLPACLDAPTSATTPATPPDLAPTITPTEQLPSELLDAALGKADAPARAAYEYSRADLKGAALCALQEHGARGVAAKAIGINRRTLYAWGEEDEEFGLAVKDVEEYCTDLIEHRLWKQAQAGDTVAGIFYLKGRRPKVWHDKARLEVSGPGGGPVPVQVEEAERAELLATAKALRAAKGGTDASE